MEHLESLILVFGLGNRNMYFWKGLSKSVVGFEDFFSHRRKVVVAMVRFPC